MNILKSKKAFTLIELLIAMTLMFIFVFAFTPFMLSGVKNIEVAEQQREEMYDEKGTIEDKLSMGITKDNAADGAIIIKFKQGSTEASGIVAGQYVRSALNTLSTFLARDDASLEISPSIMVRKPKANTEIKITCADMQFSSETEGGAFFLCYANGNVASENGKVRFIFDKDTDPYTAYMRTDSGLSLDVTKDYYIVYQYTSGENAALNKTLKAKLTVTTYGIVAVGAKGTRVYQDGDAWTTETFSAKENLQDIIWTGKQYVAAGDNGSWNFTNIAGTWQEQTVHTYEHDGSTPATVHFTCLDSYGDQICAGGHSIQTGFTGTVNANEAMEIVLTNPANIQAEAFDTFKEKPITYYAATGTADIIRPVATSRISSYVTSITSAKIGSEIFRLWANYSYYANYLTTTIRHGLPNYGDSSDDNANIASTATYIQLSPYDRIGDIEHNGYADSGRGEILAVCDTTGKIYSSKDGYNWQVDTDTPYDLDTDPLTDAEIEELAAKGYGAARKKTNVLYNVYNKTSNESGWGAKDVYPMQLDHWSRAAYTPLVAYGALATDSDFGYGFGIDLLYGDYTGIVNGSNVYTRYGNFNETVYEKTYVAEMDFANNYYGTLHSVAYGEPEGRPNGIWVAGGKVMHSRDKAYVRKVLTGAAGFINFDALYGDNFGWGYYVIRPDDPETEGTDESGAYRVKADEITTKTTETYWDWDRFWYSERTADVFVDKISMYDARFKDYTVPTAIGGVTYPLSSKLTKVLYDNSDFGNNMAAFYEITMYEPQYWETKMGSDGHNSPLIYRYSEGNQGEWRCAEIHSPECKAARGTPPDPTNPASPCISICRKTHSTSDPIDKCVLNSHNVCCLAGETLGEVNDVEFINGEFYAVGNDGWMYQSSDGIHWVAWQTKDKNNLYGIAGIDFNTY